MITCIRLPHFAASLEARAQPELQGTPLVLVDTAPDKQVVYAVSHEAAQCGVRVGMPLPQSRSLCQELQVRSADRSRYRRAFESLLEALTLFTPQVEPEAGIELRADKRSRKMIPFFQPGQVDDDPSVTCYLDLGHLHVDASQQLARQIQACVQEETGIRPKIGLASGKFTARVAATSVNSGEILMVPDGQEASFLAGFTVALLPIDGETIRQLDLLGLYTLGQIAELPIAALLDRFGKQWRIMHRLANGRDTSPVQNYTPPAYEYASHQFDSPVTNWQHLDTALKDLVFRLGEKVTATESAVQHVMLGISLEDETILENELVLRQPVAEVDFLYEKTQALAQRVSITAGIVEITLTFSVIEPDIPKQLSLFERSPVSQEQLNTVLKGLIARYGTEHFYWIQEANLDARLPERRFRLEKADLP